MPLDNILYINTASILVFDATGSNLYDVSFLGTSSYSVSSSFAPAPTGDLSLNSLNLADALYFNNNQTLNSVTLYDTINNVECMTYTGHHVLYGTDGVSVIFFDCAGQPLRLGTNTNVNGNIDFSGDLLQNSSPYTASLTNTASIAIMANSLNPENDYTINRLTVDYLLAKSGSNIGGMSLDVVEPYSVQIGNSLNSTNEIFESVQIGYSAGQFAETASFVVQLGSSVGLNATTCTNATQVGGYAGYSATNSKNSTLLGNSAGKFATNANDATMVGMSSGLNAAQSSGSVMVGRLAGRNAATGSYTTLIGTLADASSSTLNITKSIAIGYNSKVTTANTCVIGGTGIDAVKVSIGGVTAQNTLDVIGNVSCSVVTASLFTGTASYSNQSLSTSYISSSGIVGTVTSSSYAGTASLLIGNTFGNINFYQSSSISPLKFRFMATNSYIGNKDEDEVINPSTKALTSNVVDTLNWSTGLLTGQDDIKCANWMDRQLLNNNEDVILDWNTTLKMTGSLEGTASYSNKSLSASYAPQTIITTVPSASWASQSIWSVSSSFASQSISASWSPNQGATTLVTASTYQITSSWANSSLFSTSSSFASRSISASWSPFVATVSASWASASLSTSYINGNGFALNLTSSLTSSAIGLKYDNTFTGKIFPKFGGGSYALNTNVGTDKNLTVQPQITLADGIAFASVNDANTANLSMEFRASQYSFWANPVNIDGNITANTADFNGAVVFNDIIRPIGGIWDNANSTIAIDVADDHILYSQTGIPIFTFTGNGAPALVTGDLDITGNYLQNGSPYTASLANTASYVKNAVSASWASQSLSASYISSSGIVGTVTSSSYSVSSSFSVTSSYVKNAVTASYVLNAVSASYIPAIGNPFSVQYKSNVGQLTGSSLVYRFGQLGVGTGTAYTPLYDVDVKASSGTTSNIGSPFNNVNILAGTNQIDNGRYVLTLKAYDWLSGLSDSATITLDKNIVIMPESSSFGGTYFGDSSGNANVGIGDFLNPQVVGLISTFNDTYIAGYDSINDRFIYASIVTVNSGTGCVGINQTNPTLGMDINGSLGNSVGALQVATDISQVNSAWSIGDVDGNGLGNTLSFDRTTGTNTLNGQSNVLIGTTTINGQTFINSTLSCSVVSASIFYGTSSFATTASYAVTSSKLNGLNLISTSSISNISSSYVAYQLNTSSYKAMFLDYIVSSGSNMRCGKLFGCWDSGSISFSEIDTPDIGNTSQVQLSMSLSASFVNVLINSSTLQWTIDLNGKYI